MFLVNAALLLPCGILSYTINMKYLIINFEAKEGKKENIKGKKKKKKVVIK